MPGKIVLSGRLNLPEGFGPSQYEKRKELPQRLLDSSTLQQEGKSSSSGTGSTKKGLHNIAEASEEEEEDDDEDEESGSDDEDGDGEGEEGEGERKHRSGNMSRKRRQETPEEKKARKEVVKEERRNKRQGKKELKSAFKAEGARIIRSVGNEQSTDHVSVFRYT